MMSSSSPACEAGRLAGTACAVTIALYGMPATDPESLAGTRTRRVLKDFIDGRTGMWRRLEELVESIRLSRLTRLDRSEVRELARLYRRTAADLAIARQE